MTNLAQKALEVNQAFQALGNERFEADGATFIRNRAFRAFQTIRDANHVTHVTAATSSEIEALLARVEREFAGFPHRRFDLDFTTPPAFEARLALDGYQRNEELVMLLEGELAGQAKSVDIRPIRDEAGWEQYEALHEIGWPTWTGRLGPTARRGRVPPVWGRWRTSSPIRTSDIRAWPLRSSTIASRTAVSAKLVRLSSWPPRRTRRSRCTREWASGPSRRNGSTGKRSSPRGRSHHLVLPQGP